MCLLFCLSSPCMKFLLIFCFEGKDYKDYSILNISCQWRETKFLWSMKYVTIKAKIKAMSLEICRDSWTFIFFHMWLFTSWFPVLYLFFLLLTVLFWSPPQGSKMSPLPHCYSQKYRESMWFQLSDLEPHACLLYTPVLFSGPPFLFVSVWDWGSNSRPCICNDSTLLLSYTSCSDYFKLVTIILILFMGFIWGPLCQFDWTFQF